MIWHLLEIWFVLFVAFLFGCGLGSLAYVVLGRSAFAAVQGRVADAIGDYLDGLRVRLGMAPAWAEGYRRPPRELPLRRGRQAPLPPPADVYDEIEEDEGVWDDAPPTGDSLGRAPAPRIDPIWEPAATAPGDWEDGEDWDDAAIPERDEVRDEAGTLAPLPTAPALPELPAMRPAGLSAPRNGVPDDLQRIRGIGRRNEELLNSLGIFHFSQIAAWTPAEVRWIGNHLSFPERVERDDWIGQATILGSGGDTGYVKAERRRAAGAGEDETPAGDG